MRSKGAEKAAMGIYVKISLLISIVLFSFGCTVKVPMNPNVGMIELKEKLPVEAGLLIEQQTQNYVFKGTPESFTAGGVTHEIPLGNAMETASIHAFSQVFQKVDLIRTKDDGKRYKIVIEPQIADFHFRYDQLSYGGFAIAVLSRIKVRVMLYSGEVMIWEKVVESPEQKRGPWAINFTPERDVGESASAALVFTLRQIASDIVEDSNVRRSAGVLEAKKPSE